jgi:hypothetical protein
MSLKSLKITVVARAVGIHAMKTAAEKIAPLMPP